MLDTRNYTWVDRFEPENGSKSTPSSETSTSLPETSAPVVIVRDDDHLNTIKIVVGVVGGIVGITVITITGFVGYKIYKGRMRNRVLRIPGTL